MTEIIFRYRWLIVISCIVAGILIAISVPQIKIDPEIRNYIPNSIESRKATDKIETEFGSQDIIMIMFQDSCIISYDNLKQIKEIDKSISRISGVSSRTSIFTVKDIHDDNGIMVADPLIKEIPSDTTELRELSGKILDNRFARDIAVSSDLSTASITATINNSQTEKETLNRIDSIISNSGGKARIIKGGLPYIRRSILTDVSKDAIILIPAALIIMLIVLKINLGSWKNVAMPFSVVVLGTGFSMSLIPVAGWNLSIITLLVPVILIAVANNYGIYLVARYQELKTEFPDRSKKELISVLLKSLNMPILFSGLTTIAGILGLLTHFIIPAKQVGILAASGVTLALLMSLLLIPALILMSGASSKRIVRRGNSSSFFEKMLEKLAKFIIKYPEKILILSGIVILIISTGILLLRIDTNQEDYFSKHHPIRKASALINSKFKGSQTISVMISGDIKSPEIMKGIDKLTNELEKQSGVGGVFSISQVVREMSKAIFSSSEYGFDRIPDTREGIAQMFELYNMSGDPEDFKQLMNFENSKAHVLIRVSNPENRIINNITTRIKELNSGFPADVTVGGYAIIMTDFASSIIKGQVYSLVFAVITVFILLAIIFRSFKGGMIGSIPLTASILILFGFMGYTGIALDAATALLSSLMIGVGVDFTIQYIWCFNYQVNTGLTYAAATTAALKTIGRSIIINAFSVMAGFSAVTLSGFTSIRFFGYLVIISIGSCLIGALLIIPAFLIKFRPGFIGFKVNIKRKERNELENKIIGSTTAAFAGSRSAAGF